jgi:ankyrin repeat protein
MKNAARFAFAALVLAAACAGAQTPPRADAYARLDAGIRTPAQTLFRAIDDGDVLTFSRLLASGVPVSATNELGETPLYVAAEKGELAMVRLLIAGHADARALTPNGESVLHAASMIDSAALTSALVDAGAPINQANKDGETPLLWATMTGTFMAVKALADAGADLDVCDDRVGNTPLHAAAWHDDILLVHYLLSKHARTDIRNKGGLTAFELAKAGGRVSAMRLLQQQ